VDIALRRLLHLAAIEVEQRPVKLREPKHSLEVVAVRKRRAGCEQRVVTLRSCVPSLGIFISDRKIPLGNPRTFLRIRALVRSIEKMVLRGG
jgi:hypothetical protein